MMVSEVPSPQGTIFSFIQTWIMIHPMAILLVEGVRTTKVAMLTVGRTTRGIFNQATPSIWNADDPTSSLADATGGSSQANDKANRLAQMYRRPFEIMHHE